MKLSARNQLKGTVVAVTPGAVNGTVKVDLGGGTMVTSMITMEALQDLGIAPGSQVYVVIKASDVMLGTDH